MVRWARGCRLGALFLVHPSSKLDLHVLLFSFFEEKLSDSYPVKKVVSQESPLVFDADSLQLKGPHFKRLSKEQTCDAK